ncbi:adenylate/guanylate cyclase domain-containing protein [Pararcticibacter amylolyticus]|uniref:Guanylate cyclase domain-containing protein n=1 Tax=Pararcticibacter amylolyticus TaxID=2173175 RepID=A0A2U2P9V2_9SPHI|nr:adenylate/guanylate cyclase domain-containing protein [Pararcticibacter amylolyticus]PWG78161.1 hypothetical protein DDR33_23670 [Pararcticibacter amylolyticus]
MNKNTTPAYSSLSNTALLTFPYKTESNDTAFLSADSDKELAIMFLDIRNFTGLMETKPAREVIHVVRRLFSMFGKIIQSFKGTVVEVAGDSLYAVFGMGSTIQEAINEGYQAAKMIFETIDLFNDTYSDRYDGRLLEIGIGFHTGNVIVSRVETENQKQLSVMGFAVNIASRLQAKTKELNNDMIISEEAYQLLNGKSVNHEQRTVSLQGVSSRQQVRLLGKPYYGSFSLREEETHLNYIIAYSG